MPVSAIPRIPTARNGVASFVLPLKRLDFHYCDWAGSSRGMNTFLRTHLSRFAALHPSIETSVSPRPHAHPIIRATYINGREKVICVRNLEPFEVLKKAELLRDAGGERLRRVTGVVESTNQGVRGVWSGLHDIVKDQGQRRRPGEGGEKGRKGRSEGAWRI